jgi:hypothetical protein
MEPHYIVQNGLEFEILLPQLPNLGITDMYHHAQTWGSNLDGCISVGSAERRFHYFHLRQ